MPVTILAESRDSSAPRCIVPSKRSAELDLVIADLADENALLLDRIVSLETDVAVYRDIGVAALDALTDSTRSYARLRDQLRSVSEEYRALREQLQLQAGFDDEGA
jgi:uncharacterized coiled-coil protein SlyX